MSSTTFKLTRRDFHLLALRSSAGAAFALSRGHLLAQADAPPVPLQPFAAQIVRLLQAMAMLGTPLPADELAKLQPLLQASGKSEAPAFKTIVDLLAMHVLMEVELNPEMRVSVSRGAAVAELYQGGWRTFLVKVNNHAGVTPALKIKSPQGGSMGRRSSLAITGVNDFTNGAVDLVESRVRWLGVHTFDAAPLTPTLSGLAVEYRIVQLYSRDAGQREATLQADAGWGEQDLGYRSSLPVLFRCLPAQHVGLHILDENGKPSIASILVSDEMKRVYPPQTKRDLPDLNFQPQVYRYNGESLLLPAGTYKVEYTRGPEYITKQTELHVAHKDAAIRLELERWINPARFGYFSGDTHIHAAGCSHYESPTEGVTPIVMKRQVDGEALALGSVLNWGPGFEYQKQFFSGHAEPMHHVEHEAASAMHAGMPHDAKAIASEQTNAIVRSLQQQADDSTVASLVRYDIEISGFPSSHCGHLVLLQLKNGQYPGTQSIQDWPSWNIPILRWAKAQGAIVGYAHSAHGLVVDSTALPNFVMPPFNSMGANEFIADVTHEGIIDFISGCDLWPFAELNIWYHTLNCGYMTAFAGETDFPCLTDACVGGGRSYVPLPAPPEGDEGYARWLESLLHASSYFGDGRSHVFAFTVAGKPRSQEPVRLEHPGSVEVTAQVCARLEEHPDSATEAIQHASPYDKPYWHIERARVGNSRKVPVELIVNGHPVGRTEIEADGRLHPVTFITELTGSSWVALRVYPSSHTNPVLVSIGGKPVRASRRSAEWCRKAVDVCWEQKKLRIRPEELPAAAAAFEHARAAYDRILSECGPEQNH